MLMKMIVVLCLCAATLMEASDREALGKTDTFLFSLGGNVLAPDGTVKRYMHDSIHVAYSKIPVGDEDTIKWFFYNNVIPKFSYDFKKNVWWDSMETEERVACAQSFVDAVKRRDKRG